MPVRRGLEYRGYLWIRRDSFTGERRRWRSKPTRPAGASTARRASHDVDGDWKKYTVHAEANGERSARALRDSVRRSGHRLGRPGLADAGRRRGWRARRRLRQGQGARAGVHPLAGRQRRAGLSLAMGRRSARRAPDVDQPVLEERARAERFRHRRVHPLCAQRRRRAVDHRQRRRARRDRWKKRRRGSSTATARRPPLTARCAPATGIPSRIGVKYWEIGNEIWGDWVRGHSDAATYARNFNRMPGRDARRRSVDQGDRRRRQRHGVEPHRAAARRASASTTWRSTTTTASATCRATWGTCLRVRCTTRRSTATSQSLLERARAESASAAGDQRVGARPAGIAAVLDAGRALRRAADERVRAASDLVGMSAVSDLVNGWPGGIIQAGRARRVRHADLPGQQVVCVTSSAPIACGRKSTVPPFQPVGRETPRASMSWRADRPTAAVFTEGCQYRPRAPDDRSDRVRGTAVSSTATVDRVIADSLTAFNGFATPDAVRTTRSSIKAGSSFSLALPKHSIAVVTLTTAR